VEGPESGPFVTNEARSKPSIARRYGGVAEWLGSGLQSRVQRFNSAPRLEKRAGPASEQTAEPAVNQVYGDSQFRTAPLPGP
jgi:hypothetical protein